MKIPLSGTLSGKRDCAKIVRVGQNIAQRVRIIERLPFPIEREAFRCPGEACPTMRRRFWVKRLGVVSLATLHVSKYSDKVMLASQKASKGIPNPSTSSEKVW